jgi:hypothetical protein
MASSVSVVRKNEAPSEKRGRQAKAAEFVGGGDAEFFDDGDDE